MRLALKSLIGISLVVTTGCTVRYAQPEAEVTVDSPSVEVSGPVVEAPGVAVIDVEPAPVERVYVYDPGYPPGTYFYGGYVYYGGYRYPRDVFYNRYVVVNVREHRYSDAGANRRRGVEMERSQRAEFARTGGHPDAARNQARKDAEFNRNQSRKDDAAQRDKERKDQNVERNETRKNDDLARNEDRKNQTEQRNQARKDANASAHQAKQQQQLQPPAQNNNGKNKKKQQNQ